MSTSLFNYKTFNVDDIKYDTPKLVRGSSFLAKTHGDKRLLFQTPKLTSINQIEVDNKGCHLELQLTEEHVDFYEFLQKIDENNIAYTQLESNNWFQKEFPYEIIDDFYIPTVKHKSTKSIPNLNFIKIRIPTHKKEPNINVYDDKRDKIDWKRIQPGTQLIAILELKGLKFLQREVVCDWEIVQVKASIERSKINLTKILIELSKGEETNVNDDDTHQNTQHLANNFNNDDIDNDEQVNHCEQETININQDDGLQEQYNERCVQQDEAEDEGEVGREVEVEVEGEDVVDQETKPESADEMEQVPEETDEHIRATEPEIKIRKQAKPNTQETENVYNDKVIDKEMVSELAKIPDKHANPYETSDESSEITNSEVLMNNNHYKIRERRDDLLKVMREADEASKKADLLRNQAAEAAKEIKQMVHSFSMEDNNITTAPYY